MITYKGRILEYKGVDVGITHSVIGSSEKPEKYFARYVDEEVLEGDAFASLGLLKTVNFPRKFKHACK